MNKLTILYKKWIIVWNQLQTQKKLCDLFKFHEYERGNWIFLVNFRPDFDEILLIKT